MAIAVFSAAQAHPIDQDGYEYGDSRDTLVVSLGRGMHEQRSTRSSRRFRTYNVGFRVTNTQRLAIDAFFAALGMEQTSFLWEDPLDSFVAGLSCGTSVTSQTVFNLPSTGGYGGEYPQDLPVTRLFDDGVAVARTVQTDDRTITANSAPANGSVMTAECRYYRRLRLDGEYRWRRLGNGAVYETAMSWREVPS